MTNYFLPSSSPGATLSRVRRDSRRPRSCVQRHLFFANDKQGSIITEDRRGRRSACHQLSQGQWRHRKWQKHKHEVNKDLTVWRGAAGLHFSLGQSDIIKSDRFEKEN
jgi:hypothetical protein